MKILKSKINYEDADVDSLIVLLKVFEVPRMVYDYAVHLFEAVGTIVDYLHTLYDPSQLGPKTPTPGTLVF